MNVGDNLPVSLGGHTVAQARVAEMGEGKATLVIPQTVVVMAVRTELDRAPADTSGSETIVTGVDRAGTEEVVNADSTEGTNQVPEEATPAEQAQSEDTEPVRE